ncbi:MAG: hypothetical protein EBV10_09980 [Synechococcaceae bacterium WB6_1A_059]|nr:hypothetical protein [Synechococcaceae bacterium WB6_1A_059]
MASVESEFKNFLLKKFHYLNKDKIKRKSKGERPVHLRFYRGCGIETLKEFKFLFEKLDLPITSNESFTGSPVYRGQGFDIIWKKNKIGVLFGLSKTGVERKKYTPQNLKLNGLTFSDPSIFRNAIIKGLDSVEDNTVLYESLVSMLDNLETSLPIKTSKFLDQNLNKITSDFGEILSAYQSCLSGNIIFFPKKSNNNIADYYENEIPISAKGRLSGGKVNLSEYKDFIDRENSIGKFFYAIATHNKNDFFKFAVEFSKEAKKLSDWVGGTTESDIQNYISKTSYDDFYNLISKEFKNIGVPLKSKDQRPRKLWEEGDTNPFYFTLNTVIHRFWGTNATIEITKIVSKFLNKPKFVHVNIDKGNVTTEEINFNDIKEWQTIYWSRATKAWHNWMAVESKRGQK